MSLLKIIGSVDCAPEDRSHLVDFVMALKKEQIGEFLRSHGLSTSGTKEKLRTRVTRSLEKGSLTDADLIRYLDEVGPWGKQHVYLYDGPSTAMRQWRDGGWLHGQLAKHKVSKYFNAILPVVLPDSLTLSSIRHDEKSLRIFAIQKKVYYDRQPFNDEERLDEDGSVIELRAYKKYTSRGLVIFEWDFVTNVAMLQIAQLHSHDDYEQTAQEFGELVQRWFPLGAFSRIEIRRAIRALHEAEEKGSGETRSHTIGYRTPLGRSVSCRSASWQDALLGEPVVDTALRNVRNGGVGQEANFYWMPGVQPESYKNPLSKEVHIYILGGEKQRVRFSTPNDEAVVRYVLRRIRARCR